MSYAIPPLSLYVHIPWCVRKCPYCDFNSHHLKGDIPEAAYVARLLDDLQADLPLNHGRALESIFIGGGTPSLLSPSALKTLLDGIKARIAYQDAIEITLEANPGTVDNARLHGFVEAGITRFSIGVQSFSPQHLEILGRIHNPTQAQDALRIASKLRLASFNIDLMHGLPEQTPEQALADLKQAIALNPPHLSWYQLTIEPNTAFASKPPVLPDDDLLSDIEHQGFSLLEDAGYNHYEVSAFAKAGHQSKHNSLYWRFGDYLGIGCGAHGKITCPKTGTIQRRVKIKHPRGYLDLTRTFLDQHWTIAPNDLALEYFMNRFRLFEPVPKAEFSLYTGLTSQSVHTHFARAIEQGLVQDSKTHWQLTPTGRRFLNQVLAPFTDTI